MILLIVLYLLLPSLQVYFFLTEELFFGVIDFMNSSFSIIALHWILANVLISTKISWLQKLLPYKKRFRTHIISSLGISLFVIYHVAYNLLLEYEIDTVTVLLGVFLFIMFLMGIIWIPLKGFSQFRELILKRFKVKLITEYKLQKILHQFLQPIIGFLMCFHIGMAGIFSEMNRTSVSLYILLFVVSYGTYFLSIFKATMKKKRNH